MAHVFAGDLGRARRGFERALRWCPGDAESARGLARIHYRCGEAGRSLEALSRSGPVAVGVERHLLAAVCFADLGEDSRTRVSLDQALAASLSDPLAGESAARWAQGGVGADAQLESAEDRTRHADYQCRAAARLFERNPVRASERLELALTLNPNYFRARLLLALTELRIGRSDRSLALLERARELEPSYPDVLAWLGLARLRARDVTGALAALDRAAGLERGFGRALRYLALVRHAQGRTREALSAARSAFHRLPDAPGLPGRLRVPGLESEGADEEDLTLALAIRPACADLHMALGRRRLEAGDARAAREPLTRALSLQPRYAAARFELGRAELMAGSPRESARLLAPLASERPEWVDAQALLGKALLASGDAAGAVLPLRAALRRRARLEPARSDLAWALLMLRGRRRRAAREAMAS